MHTKKNKEKAHKRLTIAELRNCKGFENYSDEQAEETINTLEKLSMLLYELHMKEKQKEKNP
jgi:transcription initiation factor TFIIIB Brf1 subunit/transcription initiation factor TFIIB